MHKRRTTKTTHQQLFKPDFFSLLQIVCYKPIEIATVNTSNCWSKSPIAKWTIDYKCQMVRFEDNCKQPARTHISRSRLIFRESKTGLFLWLTTKTQGQCLGLRIDWNSHSCVLKLRLCKHRVIHEYLGDINNFSYYRQNWRTSL